MKSKFQIIIIATALILWGGSVSAEGMVDIKPYVGASVTYDDNVFRFSDSDQAEAAFGSSKMSDTITRTEAGVNVDLRLSRQLISLTSNINNNKYNQFTSLDYVGRAYGAQWNWLLTSKLFGIAGWSKGESITSFEVLRNLSKNLRTNDVKYFQANWQLHPDWVTSVGYTKTVLENSETLFDPINQEEERFFSGIEYRNVRGTELGLTIQETNTQYRDRNNQNSPIGLLLFGDETKSRELILKAAWQPTNKLRLDTRLKHTQVKYNNQDFISGVPERNFDGIGKRLTIDYIPTVKTAFNFTMFDEIYPIQDLSATYLRVKSVVVSPTWAATEKLKVTASLSYRTRDLLGDSGVFIRSSDEFDTAKSIRLSLNYSPTVKSNLSLTYTGERRSSENVAQDFDFNILNLSARYDF